MREILFRGKRVDNGNWVYGAYCHYDDIEDNGKDDCDYIIQKHNGEHFPFVKVIPSTIGQYTGFIDKNNKKIFEGDIVKVKYTNNAEYIEEITVVAYDSKTGGYSPYTWKYKCDGCGCNLFVIDNEVEVIGNIHDNTELLKETREQ